MFYRGWDLVLSWSVLSHHKQIKIALRIAGVGTSVSTWRSKTDSENGIPGFQIDLIIERADRIIHLCEMKFSTDLYGITDSYESKTQRTYRTVMLGDKE